MWWDGHDGVYRITPWEIRKRKEGDMNGSWEHRTVGTVSTNPEHMGKPFEMGSFGAVFCILPVYAGWSMPGGRQCEGKALVEMTLTFGLRV